MIHRYELTDKQFAEIENLLPAHGKRGGRWNDHRTTLNGIFWWLYTEAQYSLVEHHCGGGRRFSERWWHGVFARYAARSTILVEHGN